jgi:hypothetical protein
LIGAGIAARATHFAPIAMCLGTAVTRGGSCYKVGMSTPIITARRNLAQTIGKLLLKGEEIDLTPWQLRQVQRALEQLEEERFAEGERTMSEAERSDLYEPDGYVATELIERQRLVDQLTAVVAAT